MILSAPTTVDGSASTACDSCELWAWAVEAAMSRPETNTGHTRRDTVVIAFSLLETNAIDAAKDR